MRNRYKFDLYEFYKKEETGRVMEIHEHFSACQSYMERKENYFKKKLLDRADYGLGSAANMSLAKSSNRGMPSNPTEMIAIKRYEIENGDYGQHLKGIDRVEFDMLTVLKESIELYEYIIDNFYDERVSEMLRFRLDGLTMYQIAEKTCSTEGTVKQYIHDAKCELEENTKTAVIRFAAVK